MTRDMAWRSAALVVLLAAGAGRVAGGAFDDELYESVLDSDLCEEQLLFLSNHSLRLHFIDASAKIPSGILGGNLYDLGDYFQCLGIDQLVQGLQIQGKYCAITVPLDQQPIQLPQLPELPDWNITWPVFPQPDNQTDLADQVLVNYNKARSMAHAIMGINPPAPVQSRIFPLAITSQLGATFGVCVPRVCSVRRAVQFAQDSVPFLNVTFNELYCRLPGDKPLATADIVAIVIFSVIGLLVITCTSYDLWHVFVLERDASPLYRSFSVYTNTRRLLTFNSPAGALECVDGIRAISMLWVVVGHTYSCTLLGFIHNMRDIIDWLGHFSSTWVNAAPITVDTFFLLSGILAVYSIIGKISKSRFVRTIHLFYLNRLLRMFPLLAAVVLLQASLLHHASDGPFWQNMAQTTQHCRQWWWSALLHVQNYVNPLETCVIQTWYLSVDMQLYVLSPLVLVWLFGGERRAGVVLAAVMLLSLVGSTLYAYLYNFSAALANISRFMEFREYVQIYYMNTLARAPPFVVGLVYGYLLHLWRGRRIRIPRSQVALLWVLSLAMMAFCVGSIYPVMQLDHEAQQFDNFLNAYMRAIWAIALGWVIFACVQGYGGPVNWFLSLRMWKLPARLSFAMYLVHVPVIMIANSSWVKTHYFTNGETFYRFTADLMFTFVAALALCVTIDAPCSTLQKMLLAGGKKKPPLKQHTESRQNVITVEDDKYVKTSL